MRKDMECSVLTLPALHIWQIHSFFTAFLVKIFQPLRLPTRRVFYGLPHRLAAKVDNFKIRLALQCIDRIFKNRDSVKDSCIYRG